MLQSSNESGIRKKWEDYCKTLNKPALEQDGKQYIKRDIEDLDKSISELAAEGKLKNHFDSSSLPPKKLSLNTDGEQIEIAILKKEFLWIILSMLALPGIFIYIGFWGDAHWVFGAFGIVFASIVLIAMISTMITTRLIRINEKGLHVLRKIPWGYTKGSHILAKQIESVTVALDSQRNQKVLLVKTDYKTHALGHFLDDESLKWLKGYVLWMLTPTNK